MYHHRFYTEYKYHDNFVVFIEYVALHLLNSNASKSVYYIDSNFFQKENGSNFRTLTNKFFSFVKKFVINNLSISDLRQFR